MQDSVAVVLFDGGGEIGRWFRDSLRQLSSVVRIVQDEAGLERLAELDSMELFIVVSGVQSAVLTQKLPQLRTDFPTAVVALVHPHGETIDGELGDFIVDEALFSSVAQVEGMLRNLIRLAAERKESTTLSAMLIHDLRSPVQSIIGYLELLEQEVFGAINEGQKKILSNALSQGDVIRALLEELALVFQLESRQYNLIKMPMRASQMIQEALRALWVLADQKNIKLVPQVPNDLPVLKADSLSVSRVLNNLVNNAIKFTPMDGTIRVTVRQTRSASNKSMLEFCIIDSGPGIPGNQLEHIFDKYYRLKTETETKNGQGLGLYICRLLVEAHGGKVGAYNNREGGSTFYFTLPVKEE